MQQRMGAGDSAAATETAAPTVDLKLNHRRILAFFKFQTAISRYKLSNLPGEALRQLYGEKVY
jgi:hypothetical protein